MCSITVTVAKINRILCSILFMLGKLWLKYYTQEIDVEITMLVFFFFACLLIFFVC